MTSKDILKSSFLEILFENRNKEYGAYTLRKYYDVRLATALAIALGTVFLLSLVIPSVNKNNSSFLQPEDVVMITQIDLPKPPSDPPPMPPSLPPQRSIATQQFTNNIQLVTEDILTDVPAINELVAPRIESLTQAGDINFVNPPVETNVGSIAGSVTEEPAAFDPIEVQPQFPGGKEAWMAFLRRHLETPQELEAGDKKTVLVKFIVGEDGNVAYFQVVQSGGSVYDNEVIRVLKKMPKWKPAIQNGHYIQTSFTQPVTFQRIEE
jgi:protein TonB